MIVVESNAARRASASEPGATRVIDPADGSDVLAMVKELGGGGGNHALDTTGIPAVIAVAVETVLPHGTLGLIAVPPPEATLPANMMSMLVPSVIIKYITERDADRQVFIPQMLDCHRGGRFPLTG